MATRFASLVQHEDVADVVGTEYALRGWEYFENGHVFDTRQIFQVEQERLQLWALCAGSQSEPYQVSIFLNNTPPVRSRCTCPIGSGCKHVAAVLYAWIHEPGIFEAAQDWRARITLWSKERLLGVIFSIAEQSSRMEAFLQEEVEGWSHSPVDILQEAADTMRSAPLWEMPGLADELVEQGYGEHAVMLITERLGEGRSGVLVDWLIEHYERLNDYSSALMWARRRLDDIPKASYYATVWSVAQRLDVWSALRPALLARLKRADYVEYLKVLLLERRVGEAFEAYEEGLLQGEHFPDAIRLNLAEAVEDSDPTRALELYRTLVGGLIERRTREYYRMAAHVLARVESLYSRLGRTEEWQQVFDEFMASYPRRPALIQELERANLLGME